MQAKTVKAGQGVEWLICGWGLFKHEPGPLILMTLIFFVIGLVAGFIPFIGSLAVAFLVPALTGGLMYVARELDGGRKIEVGDLFRAFKVEKKIYDFLVIGAISIGLSMLAIIIAIVFGIGSVFMTVATGGDPGPGLLLSLLMFILLFVPVMFVVIMLQFYGIPLVMLDNAKPLDAMKSSFFACLKNYISLTVLSLVVLIPFILAMIPFGLGMIILGPILYMTQYSSFRNIYH